MAKIQATTVIIIILSAVMLALVGISAYFPGFIGKLSPTGMASSGLGYATVDVVGTLGITITGTASIVNLSLSTDTAGASGAYVATNASIADINSYDNTSNEDWLNATGAAPRIIAQSNITVVNTGSVVANITLCANTNPILFFSSSGGDFWTNSTAIQEPGSCNGEMTTLWKEYGNNSSLHGNTSVCGKLLAQDSADMLEIWIKWRIPAGAPVGAYNDTLTIIAKQSGP